MQTDVTKMTVEQIKALAYDQIVLLEQAQNNLKILNAEIQKRLNEPKEVKSNERAK